MLHWLHRAVPLFERDSKPIILCQFLMLRKLAFSTIYFSKEQMLLSMKKKIGQKYLKYEVKEQ